MNLGQKLNRKGDKIYFFYDLGRKRGQRPATGVYIYAKPKYQEDRHFLFINKTASEILSALLKTKEINIMTYHETDMVYDYLSQEPGCKVFKIVQRPYDIYIGRLKT